jgi:hypothetical protein
MTNADISRFLVQPRKHYVGTRMQQGRVVLDSDFNEEAELDDEERRKSLLDIVGASGSPNEGFLPDLAVGDEVTVQSVSFGADAPVATLDYRLRPGSMYVSGLRFDHEQRTIADRSGGDPVVFQRDFLDMRAPDAPRPEQGATHTQLSYLHGWTQCVTAIEDEEFRERALGGIDTSVRVRHMARVETREVDNGDDCTAAWEEIRQQIEADSGATFDETGHELRSSARLRLTFVAGEALDPCAPCAPDDVGRYLGAENQAIRIMLAGPDRYVWGFDNAAPLYRVEIGAAEDGLVPVRMITLPRDEARWPLVNSVVEFLPWGALLENNEKVAAEVGAFLRVAEGFNPDEGSFRIAEVDLPQLEPLIRQWDAAHPDVAFLPNTADPDGHYFYLRAWHRLDDEDDDVLLDTASGPDNHALLRRQGLLPEFNGSGRAGDFWVVAARPNTPQQITPWNLTQPGGVPPHGPRHVYAPLALVTFRPPTAGEHENTEVVEAFHDCRQRFRPLVDRGGCCTRTVGDGVVSRGDFLSIQAAVNSLPLEGGRVCVLAGSYAETIRIERAGVTIEGCGAQVRLRTPTTGNGLALVHVLAARVAIRDLGLSTTGQIGILAGQPELDAGVVAADLVLDRLTIDADEREGVNGQARAAIDVRNGRSVLVRDCEVTMRGAVSDEAAMFVRGTDIRVEGCHLEVERTTDSFAAWGGIQIGGGTTRAHLERNRIVGGVGHGITLGSLEWVARTTTSTHTQTFGAGTGLQNTQDPCAPVQEEVHPVEVENVRFDPETAGDLSDITIVDNTIEFMSGNGVSTLTTLRLGDDGEQDLITVDRIAIERNRITNCVVQSRSLAANSPVQKTKKLQPGQQDVFGQFLVSTIPPAGIALVDGEHITIRDNEINDNGTTDPAPICGVCVVFGNDILIEGNRIQNNGRRQPASIPSISSMRAGIAVSLAGVASDQAQQNVADPIGSSLRVIGNIVEHPNGPALAARATGPLTVEDNYLISLGNNATAQLAGTAHAVSLVDVGLPWEALDLPEGEPAPERWTFPPRTPEYLQREPGGSQPGGEQRVGHGGPILFANNHVALRWVEAANAAAGLASGFSVGISSLDEVTLHGNQFALNVEDPGTKKTKGGTVFNRQPRVSAHVVAVGATANVGHNRVAEGVNDALISLLALGGFMVAASYNLTTHMSFSATSHGVAAQGGPVNDNDAFRVHRGNLVWLRPALASSGEDLVSVQTVNGTAEQLFVSLSDTVLGLGPPGGAPPLVPILTIFVPRG